MYINLSDVKEKPHSPAQQNNWNPIAQHHCEMPATNIILLIQIIKLGLFNSKPSFIIDAGANTEFNYVTEVCLNLIYHKILISYEVK